MRRAAILSVLALGLMLSPAMGADKSRLSKRHGSVSVRAFRDAGWSAHVPRRAQETALKVQEAQHRLTVRRRGDDPEPRAFAGARDKMRVPAEGWRDGPWDGSRFQARRGSA